MTHDNYREPGEFGEGATGRRADPIRDQVDHNLRHLQAAVDRRVEPKVFCAMLTTGVCEKDAEIERLQNENASLRHSSLVARLSHEQLNRFIRLFDGAGFKGHQVDVQAKMAVEDNASVMEEIMSVSSVDNEEANELLKSFTGTEGGTQQVDWYGLRDTIAAGIAKAKYDQRQIDRRILSALTPAPDLQAENERLPQDVVNLVIAAREFWDVAMDESDESAALDCALEAFSSRVPYENELAEDRAALERT